MRVLILPSTLLAACASQPPVCQPCAQAVCPPCPTADRVEVQSNDMLTEAEAFALCAAEPQTPVGRRCVESGTSRVGRVCTSSSINEMPTSFVCHGQ